MAVERDEFHETHGRLKFLVSTIGIVIAQCLLFFALTMRTNRYEEGSFLVMLPVFVLVAGFYFCEKSSNLFLKIGLTRIEQKDEEALDKLFHADNLTSKELSGAELLEQERQQKDRNKALAEKFSHQRDVFLNEAVGNLNYARIALFIGVTIFILVLLWHSDFIQWLSWKLSNYV